MENLISWSNSFNLGIKSIDEQHITFVDNINILHHSVREKKINEALKKVLDNLENYANTHFAHEESYFIKYKYPDMAKHLAEHLKFKKMVKKMNTSFEKGDLQMATLPLKNLADWFTNHILVEDRKYVEFLIKQGAK